MDMHPQSWGETAFGTATPSAVFASEIPLRSSDPVRTGAGPAPLLSIVRLLDQVGDALGSDRGEAHRYIQKAAALLRGQSEIKDVAKGHSPGTARCRLAPWQVGRATRFIDENLGKKMAIREIAGVTRLSSSHFSRAFRSTIGESPHAYIIRRRIERAQHLMRATRMPLADIALECGFSDQAHLNKLFRRVVGMPPGAWRRAHDADDREVAA